MSEESFFTMPFNKTYFGKSLLNHKRGNKCHAVLVIPCSEGESIVLITPDAGSNKVAVVCLDHCLFASINRYWFLTKGRDKTIKSPLSECVFIRCLSSEILQWLLLETQMKGFSIVSKRIKRVAFQNPNEQYCLNTAMPHNGPL